MWRWGRLSLHNSAMLLAEESWRSFTRLIRNSTEDIGESLHFIKVHVFLAQYKECTHFFYFFFLFQLLKILKSLLPQNGSFLQLPVDPATWTGFLWASSPGFRRCSFGIAALWCWRVTKAFPPHSSLHAQKPWPLGWGSGGCSRGNLLKDWSFMGNCRFIGNVS